MAIALQSLLDDPQKFRELVVKQDQCAHCSVTLQETITGRRPTPTGDSCSDCYYEKIGELIEAHPIATVRVRRG